MDKLPEWFEELKDEYRASADKRSARSQGRLLRVYRDVAPAVMMAAVDRYMQVGRFFPGVSDLRPHVDAALEDARGLVSYTDVGDTDDAPAREDKLQALRDLHDARMAHMREMLALDFTQQCVECGEKTLPGRACVFCADMRAMQEAAGLAKVAV